MKKLFFIFCCIILQLNAKSQSLTFGGTIINSTNWNYDTVNIVDNIFIPDSVVLNIAAGTKIIMNGYYRWTVKGCIKAIGNMGDTIIFTVNNPANFWDTTTNNGGWGGLKFDNIANSVDSSIFQYCKFEYGKAYKIAGTDSLGGAILIINSNQIKFENCVFINNYAIYGGGAIALLSYSSPIIRNCLFENNKLLSKKMLIKNGGGAIWIYYFCNPLIENNIFRNNYSLANGGAIAIIEKSAAKILKNKIIFNYAKSCGGGIYSSTVNGAGPFICSNTIACNTSTSNGSGIYESNSIIYIINNLIFNNSNSGIFNGHEYGHGYIVNNTIVGNQGGLASCGSMSLYNNIFWNNLPNHGNITDTSLEQIVYMPSYYTLPMSGVTNCIVQGGYPGNNNINQYPRFINFDQSIGVLTPQQYENCDFKISDSSIAINNGLDDTTGLFLPCVDMDGNNRIHGGRIDIGAYENQNPFVKIYDKNNSNNDLLVFPNPIIDDIQFQTKILKISNDAKIEIYSNDGVLVFSTIFEEKIKLSHLPSGIYLLNLIEKNKIIYSVKIIKL